LKSSSSEPDSDYDAPAVSDLSDILLRLDRIEQRLTALDGGGTAAATTGPISIDGVQVSAGGTPEPSEEVRALLRQPGKEIHAIKRYREQTGLSLGEAKDALARYHF
jgi:ribosomal protein L7/L12